MIALLLAAAVTAAQADATSFKTIASFQAATITYAPGQAEAPGNHGYDVVLVPVDDGMTVTLEGAPVTWTAGAPILVSRGAPHSIVNRTDHKIQFVEVRTVGDNPAGNDATVAASGATIVRSAVGKYVRATVWRLERGGHVQWAPGVDQVLVMRRMQDVDTRAGTKPVETTLLAEQDHWDNRTDQAIEFVRVSRMAAGATPE